MSLGYEFMEWLEEFFATRKPADADRPVTRSELAKAFTAHWRGAHGGFPDDVKRYVDERIEEHRRLGTLGMPIGVARAQWEVMVEEIAREAVDRRLEALVTRHVTERVDTTVTDHALCALRVGQLKESLRAVVEVADRCCVVLTPEEAAQNDPVIFRARELLDS